MDAQHGSMAGYVYNSQDCYLCHPNGQKGQFVGHDGEFFPIFSGTHQGEWSDCTVCHSTPGNRKPVDCLPCHDQPTTDGAHGNMAGYVYNSDDCYFCHPTGVRGQFTSHDGQFFPIFSGTHSGQWTDCTECHTTPNDRSVYDCLVCHTNPTTDGIHAGMQGYSFSSPACYDCHPTGQKGSFVDHDAQFFPIYNGPHKDIWNDDCSICHTVANNRSVFTCLSCHEHSQSTMDEKHREETGYSYSSPSCLSCHPNGKH
jgi:hypothetical protein